MKIDIKKQFNQYSHKINKFFQNKKNSRIVICVALFILVIFMSLSLIYSNKFYPRTTIGDVKISSLTKDEAKVKIKDYLENYTLKIKGRGDTEIVINAKDIDLKASYDQVVDECFNDTHSGLSIYRFFTSNNYSHEYDVSFNQDKLNAILSQSIFVVGNDKYKVNAPVNAYVQYDSKKKTGVIVEEKLGNQLNIDETEKLLCSSIKQLDNELDLEKSKAYLEPNIVKNSDAIKNELKTYNQLVHRWISWDMGKNHYETITPEHIKDWITIGINGEVGIDQSKVSQWVENFCLKYKTVGKERKFKSHTGEMIAVSGGDFGWQLNYNETLEQANKALNKENKQSNVDSYIKNPNKKNQKALTSTLEPIYKNKGQKMDYKNLINDWDDTYYSEVDLTEQKVYVFANGEVVYTAPCVTGLPSDPTRATRTGCWYIKDKKLTYTLVGADYSTPTEYWVRIMWTGTGYHYMNRSDWSRWSPEIYKTRGSHGCINLQYNDAKSIYNLVHMRDMVFIH